MSSSHVPARLSSPAPPFTPDDLDPYPPADDTGLWLELAEARIDQAFDALGDAIAAAEQVAALNRTEAS